MPNKIPFETNWEDFLYMRVYNGNTTTWKHTPTKSMRVPKVLAEKCLDYARFLDSGQYKCKLSLFEIRQKILELAQNIEDKKSGFKSNSATQLIKDILSLKEQLDSEEE